MAVQFIVTILISLGTFPWASFAQDTCTYTFNVDHEDGCSVIDGTVSQLSTTVNELHSQVTSLLQQNTDLLQHNIQLLENNAYWRQVADKKLDDIAGSITGVGAEYTRWGRTECPVNTSLVYSGYAAGSHFSHTGGSSELLCLPEDPEWGRFVNGFQGESYVYGTEWETRHKYGTNHVFLMSNAGTDDLHNRNVPCAVCFTEGRSTVKKFPAKLHCPNDWRHEYRGYLMAGHHTHKTHIQAVCLDEAPETVPSGSANEDGSLLYNMEAHCGSLPCPNYVNGRELSCVVCSR